MLWPELMNNPVIIGKNTIGFKSVNDKNLCNTEWELAFIMFHIPFVYYFFMKFYFDQKAVIQL